MLAECLLALTVCDRRFLVGCALSLVGALGSLTTTLAQGPVANPGGPRVERLPNPIAFVEVAVVIGLRHGFHG